MRERDGETYSLFTFWGYWLIGLKRDVFNVSTIYYYWFCWNACVVIELLLILLLLQLAGELIWNDFWGALFLAVKVRMLVMLLRIPALMRVSFKFDFWEASRAALWSCVWARVSMEIRSSRDYFRIYCVNLFSKKSGLYLAESNYSIWFILKFFVQIFLHFSLGSLKKESLLEFEGFRLAASRRLLRTDGWIESGFIF